ncbi:putative protein of unknown function (DUF4200) [Trypanosoma vivax]|nr:flagellar associated protein [Trypanosoma vivax]KAH8603445.1 putative protein of unknown function (DUF4200) [Trypanosoma vivax]
MAYSTSALLASNPFRGTPAKDGETGHLAPDHTVTIAQDIKQGDVEMELNISSLAQKVNTKVSLRQLLTNRRGAGRDASTPPKQRRAIRTLEIKEMHSTGTFIAKKREVGLMRLALANKEAEIRSLEEEMDRVDKKLRQQQEQLVSTEEKFNNFLKYSSLEQDAAVRRAEHESKIKQKRLIDIKKLSAQITHLEQDMRKTEVQLELCVEYKTFMDNLTTPQWFYDVLTEFRVKDISEKILLETEESYVKQAEQLTKQAGAQLGTASRRATDVSCLKRPIYPEALKGLAVEEEEEEEPVPLETQLEELHQRLEEEAERRQSEEAKRIKEEICALRVEEAREMLYNDYPHESIPMFFTEPHQILDIFINVEEGNLFLIQNSQELEEELERVAVEFLQEQEEMTAMVKQRRNQMESLATRIRESQQRLSQLEERLVDVESSDAIGIALDDGGKRGVAGYSKKDKDVMKQEVLKKSIENTVADIFRSINQRPSNPARRHDASDGAQNSGATGMKKPVHGSSKTAVQSPRGGTKGKRRSTAPLAVSGGGGEHVDSETSANMGPVEMLTIIENKVDEYHRYITDPKNGVEESLIMSVLKTRDKERRHQARAQHLVKQSLEREERNRRALERSQAPVVKHRGKPIMWRSRPPVEAKRGKELSTTATTFKEAEQDEEFF